MSEDYLEHHGVKGMKWGVRKERSGGSASNRMINKPVKKTTISGRAAGSVTNALNAYNKVQVKRLKNKQTQLAEKQKLKDMEADAARKEQSSPAKKTSSAKTDPKTLTDAQLNDHISRLEREKKYRDLTATNADKVRERAKKVAGDIMADAAKKALTKYLSDAIYAGVTGGLQLPATKTKDGKDVPYEPSPLRKEKKAGGIADGVNSVLNNAQKISSETKAQRKADKAAKRERRAASRAKAFNAAADAMKNARARKAARHKPSSGRPEPIVVPGTFKATQRRPDRIPTSRLDSARKKKVGKDLVLRER